VSYWKLALLVGIVFVATFQSTSILLSLRSALFDVPRTSSVSSHGISHNLYMGLAVEGNPWGIKWDDGAAHADINAGGRIPYGSDQHFSNLRQRYLSIVANHPVQVAQIYANKLLHTLLVIPQKARPSLIVATCTIALLLSLALLLRRRSTTPSEALMLFVAWASFGMVVLQGVLAMPAYQFVSPGKFASVAGFVVLLETTLRSMVRDRSGKVA
jgi:hypothetical protein